MVIERKQVIRRWLQQLREMVSMDQVDMDIRGTYRLLRLFKRPISLGIVPFNTTFRKFLFIK